ncbi:MAG: hypothetical protein QOE41_1744 [Mycobacterium sp.]|jgi:hypothetical protein|nr:hypothetical protein [Mycobacterium sp.]
MKNIMAFAPLQVRLRVRRPSYPQDNCLCGQHVATNLQ